LVCLVCYNFLSTTDHSGKENYDEEDQKSNAYCCKNKTTKKPLDETTQGKKFIPFQYYATEGEEDNEKSQSNSESTKSTWDQKMDEA
jgi:hypothetical protein